MEYSDPEGGLWALMKNCVGGDSSPVPVIPSLHPTPTPGHPRLVLGQLRLWVWSVCCQGIARR